MIGTTVENAKRVSARSIIQTFALSFPKNILHRPTTWNSKIGLQGNLKALFSRCQNLILHTQAPVTRVEKIGADWFVLTPTGRHGPYEAVVINATPHVGRKLVSELPWAAPVAALLARYEYFDARLVIHTDPIYVAKERRHWALYNAGIEKGECEGSVWLGAIHERIEGRTVDVFKSWAARRQHEAKDILFERRFRHPLITADSIRAARGLKKWQGHEGLWFAGQFTTGIDMQDTALYSAMCVGRALNTSSPNLKALKNRLAAKGQANLTYEL